MSQAKEAAAQRVVDETRRWNNARSLYAASDSADPEAQRLLAKMVTTAMADLHHACQMLSIEWTTEEKVRAALGEVGQ
jgi:hypothetical protein